MSKTEIVHTIKPSEWSSVVLFILKYKTAISEVKFDEESKHIQRK